MTHRQPHLRWARLIPYTYPPCRGRWFIGRSACDPETAADGYWSSRTVLVSYLSGRLRPTRDDDIAGVEA